MECVLEWGEESFIETEFNMNANEVIFRLMCYVENEARSCSMNFGCVTLLYVYRMLGGAISFEDIQAGLAQIRAER